MTTGSPKCHVCGKLIEICDCKPVEDWFRYEGYRTYLKPAANPQAHGRAAHGRAVIPVPREQVDAALLLLEHCDIPAANLVRNYLDGLESRVRTFELGADEEPGSWSYSWEQGE